MDRLLLPDNARVWVSSDWHFLHKNISGPDKSEWKDGYRDFKDEYEMTDHLINEINTWVKEDDVIVFLGDFSFKDHRKIPELRARIACKIIYVIEGNHDCFDAEHTEFLTKNGWKKYHQINDTDLLASFNRNTENIEYAPPIARTLTTYSGQMYSIKGVVTDLLITPNHKLYCKSVSTANYPFRLEEVKNLQRHAYKVKISGKNLRPDYTIDDNIIRLAAWVLSDGSVYPGVNGIRYKLYQSEGKHQIIENLLRDLNIPHTHAKRDRDITSIQGIELKNKCKISHEYSIVQGSVLEKYVQESYNFPKWLSMLSKRQFDIFLETFVLADGSKHRAHPETSWVIYGRKDVIDQLQQLCIENGHRTSIYTYRNTQHRLNINVNCRQVEIYGTEKNIKVVDFKGLICCFQTHNETLIIRRNGKISITGNSHLSKYASCFTAIRDKLDVMYRGDHYICDHYAHRVWLGSQKGYYHLYAHSHDSLDRPPNQPWGKSMDVGIDSARRITGLYRPFSLAEIKTMLDLRETKIVDHHNSETNIR